MSKAITVVGANEQGKSTYVKEILKNLNCKKHIVDIGGEHHDVANSVRYEDIEDFYKVAKNIKNSAIFIDEATVFLDTNKHSSLLKWLLVRRSKRHNNNMVFTSWHAIAMIPRDIIRFTNYIVLFPTVDIPDDVFTKFKGFPNAIDAYNAGTPARFNPVIIPVMTF